jgi:hypothetical protein
MDLWLLGRGCQFLKAKGAVLAIDELDDARARGELQASPRTDGLATGAGRGQVIQQGLVLLYSPSESKECASSIGRCGEPDAAHPQGDTMLLTTRFDDALAYVSALHRHQLRKGTAIPYLSHLMTVSALVLEHGGDEDQAIAGLLHDAAEDQGGEATLQEIERRYGDDVARIVADCTDAWTEPKPPWRQRKEAYLAKLPTKPARSLLVSLADKAHNASAILRDHRALGESLWERFNGGRAGTVWYYSALSETFARCLPGPLAEELQRSVAAFPAG